MTEPNSKIVILRDYAKVCETLTEKDIEALLSELRTDLRELDSHVSDLLSRKHKLTEAERLKDAAMIVERYLVATSDLLEDEISEDKNGKEQNARQAFLRQCEQLIARNERIKKNLSDDMTACRYIEAREALNPMAILGSIAGSAAAAGALTRYVTDKTGAILQAAAAGATIGAAVSFHRQIKKTWDCATEMVVSVPRLIRESTSLYYLKANGRNTAFAMAWTFSVYAKRRSKIESRQPVRNGAIFRSSIPTKNAK